MTSTQIASAGEVHLHSGVAVTDFHVSALGSEVISADARGTNAIVEGFQSVNAGGTTENTSVLSGGIQSVACDVTSTVVSAGGLFEVLRNRHETI